MPGIPRRRAGALTKPERRVHIRGISDGSPRTGDERRARRFGVLAFVERGRSGRFGVVDEQGDLDPVVEVEFFEHV